MKKDIIKVLKIIIPQLAFAIVLTFSLSIKVNAFTSYEFNVNSSTIGGIKFNTTNYIWSYFGQPNNWTSNLAFSKNFKWTESPGAYTGKQYFILSYCSTAPTNGFIGIYSGYDNGIIHFSKNGTCNFDFGGAELFTLYIYLKVSYFDTIDYADDTTDYIMYFTPTFGWNNTFGYNIPVKFVSMQHISEAEMNALVSTQKQADNVKQTTEEVKKSNGFLANIWNGITDLPRLIKDHLWSAFQFVVDTLGSLPGLIWNAIKGGFDAIVNGITSLFSFLKDDSAPNSDVSGLGNVQGLLPAGPVDSLMNIPFVFTSTVISSLNGSCSPVGGRLIANYDLYLPCFRDTIYGSMPSAVLTWVGLIPATFILIGYFKHLYKKVGRATSLSSTDEDEWGVV